MKQARLRLGIIGCGVMGARHAEILARHPRARLVACCNRSRPAAESLARRFACETTGDADALLARPDIDAIVIATRHDSHAPLAMAAAAAGKHALIEKPLALRVEDCRKIAEAFHAARRHVGVVLNWRFSPLVREARRRLPRPTVLIGVMMDDRWPDEHWAQQPHVGGGNLRSQGCHMADLLRYLAGAEPVEISATAASATHTPDDEPDQFAATIRFASGVIASWTQGDAGCPARGSKFQISLFGAGSDAIEIHDRCQSATARFGRRIEEWRRESEEGLALRVASFVDDVLADRAPECGAWDGLIATQMVEAALQSARARRTVTIRWRDGRPQFDAPDRPRPSAPSPHGHASLTAAPAPAAEASEREPLEALS
jgi:predicted dehydrogenase